MSPNASPHRALIRKALWPATLAVFYFWGTGYHDELLRQWGFNPDLFPIGIQQTYISAYGMIFTLLSHFITGINRYPSPSIVVLPLALLAFASLVVTLAWLLSRPILRTWGKKMNRWATSRPLSERSPFVRTLVNWCAGISVAAMSLPTAFYVILMLVLVTAVPPQYAGRASFRAAWEAKEYEKWSTVTWIDDEGHPRSGHLLTCSDRWCAIFEGTFAISVPISQVKLSKLQVPTPTRAKGPA